MEFLKNKKKKYTFDNTIIVPDFSLLSITVIEFFGRYLFIDYFFLHFYDFLFKTMYINILFVKFL